MLGLSPDALKAFHKALAMIRSNPSLRRFAWHRHYQLFHVDRECIEEVYDWMGGLEMMGELAPMLPAVMALSGIHHMREFHAAQGIPSDIGDVLLPEIGLWMRDHYTRYGTWGLTHLCWLVYHLYGMLYQLGRLQFVPGPCLLNVRVFKNTQNGEIITLSNPGITYRNDGQIDGMNGVHDPDAWVSELGIADDLIRGNSIDDRGNALRETVQLKTSEWEQVLATGDPILEVHVYAGDPLDYDRCRESYDLAKEFFPRYFPNKPFRGFACGSWLLDPNLEKLLPADSNIVRFQMDYRRIPMPGGDWQTFERVFGSKTDDLASLPRDTSLRRAIRDHLISGNQMWFSGGFILAD